MEDPEPASILLMLVLSEPSISWVSGGWRRKTRCRRRKSGHFFNRRSNPDSVQPDWGEQDSSERIFI